MKKKYFNYELFDKEARALIFVLNSFKGIKTSEHCCGHGKQPFRIWLSIDKDFPYLQHFMQAFDIRYGCPSPDWKVCLVSTDTYPSGKIHIMIEGPVGKRAYEEALTITYNLEYQHRVWIYPNKKVRKDRKKHDKTVAKRPIMHVHNNIVDGDKI